MPDHDAWHGSQRWQQARPDEGEGRTRLPQSMDVLKDKGAAFVRLVAQIDGKLVEQRRPAGDRSRVSPHQVERGLPEALPAALGGGNHRREECRWIMVLRAHAQPEWSPAAPREGRGETFR
jgi:hypothetical protein